MTRASVLVWPLLGATALACSEPGPGGTPASERPMRVVQVRLDGVPASDAIVMLGGDARRWATDADGLAHVPIADAEPDAVFMAAHPGARTRAVELTKIDGGAVTIDLTRLDPTDNTAFVFRDPGEPTRRGSTEQCGHCHVSINADWFASQHMSAARNPVVTDLYAGTSSALSTETACTERGGTFSQSPTPGTGELAERCRLGDGVLPALNPCSGDARCVPKSFGGCADCHAPGIDGKAGGRDLLEARGFAYDYGVHCDVCHHVESVDEAAPPGVAGRLRLLRPSEPSPSPGLGDWRPVTFGPRPDVPNPLMGGVERTHFHDGRLCGGCHQLDQPALVPGSALDAVRWPDGKLPIHSTYDEWKSGPLAKTPCPSCHMPPSPSVGNSADLFNMFGGPEGIAAGWERTPGSVRRHTWLGPRTPASGFARLAAALFIEKTLSSGEVLAKVTALNAGSGHALPTGEPMRSVVLVVSARCGDTALEAVGGDAIPDFGGYYARRASAQDWTDWPGAKTGQRVTVIRRTGVLRDYEGFGPFGDGRFSKEQKGMPEEVVVGSRTIASVSGSKVGFDAPLPAGDFAYRVDAPSLPADGSPSLARAGGAGFAFARVLVGADGRRMVPHFLAVDVASDNRLLPGRALTTTHRFKSACAEPEVHAALVHRAYPFDLAQGRGFPLTELVLAEAKR